MRHHVMYVPGLGDHYDGVRRAGLYFWRFFGVTTELVPMQWYDGKSYETKLRQVETAIEKAQAHGKTVSLVGESAGASMAINVFAADPSLHRLISLCGINRQTSPISSSIFGRSRAFKKSVSLLEESQKRVAVDRLDRITSITALSDPTVPVGRNIIPHAKHIKVWSVGHVTTILLCLSIYSFVLIREIKKEN